MVNNSLWKKNSPRLGGLLLDVIPRRDEMAQPLDTIMIAENSEKSKIFCGFSLLMFSLFRGYGIIYRGVI